MSAALVPSAFDHPQIPGLILTSTSAIIDPAMTAEHFDAWCRMLDRTATSMGWWIGDTVIAQMVRGREGDETLNGVEPATQDQPLATRAARICLQFPPERRVAAVTWSHHAEVAPLPEADQDRLLALAAEEGWSVRRLREQVADEREAKAPRLPLPDLPWTVQAARLALRAAYEADPHGGAILAFSGEVIALSAAEIEGVLAMRSKLGRAA